MSESLPFNPPGPLERTVTPTLEADPQRIERMLDEDRRAIEQARERNARQRQDARRARDFVRIAQQRIRRAARG